jgi:tetratricopeptide (TPR) repeat protein
MSADAFAIARERFEARDYHGTIVLLRTLAREGGLYADALNLLGLALAMVDQPEEAIEAFDRALALNPSYVEAHVNRGVLLGDLGRADEARSAFARAAALGRPDASGFPAMVANRLANSHAALAEEYRAAGALDDAVAQYRVAVRLRPGFADLQLALGRALLDRGDHAEAADALDAALAVRPDWLDAMLLRGLAAYLQGRLEAAGEIWERAAQLHPEEARLGPYRAMLALRLPQPVAGEAGAGAASVEPPTA